MPVKRILVASPAEPSGGSWLLNCFLELGIKVGHKPFVDNVWRGSNPPLPADHIWKEVDGRHELNPKAGMLVKFLPGANRQTRFAFRSDVELEYVQDFSPPAFDERPLVLIVRDPRDSIYSMYRRVAPELSFDEFYHFPHPATLLDSATHWALFVAGWLDHPNLHIVRFEDYKRDAEATLRAVVDHLDLGCSTAEIEAALKHSSFEKAREAETAFREKFPGDKQVVNRAGKVGDGRGQPEVQALIPDIERATLPVLRRLGYDVDAAQASSTSAARLNAMFLNFFNIIRRPDDFCQPEPDMTQDAHHLFKLLAFAHRLDDDLIRRAALLPDDARQLIDSLAELTTAHRSWLDARLTATRGHYSDGSDYFFQRIKELRKARAQAKPGPAS